MADNRVREMFDEIVATTHARSLKWEAAASEGEFVATMAGKYVIKLFPYTYVREDGEPMGGPSITIDDDKGVRIMDIDEGPAGIQPIELRRFATRVNRIVNRLDEKIDDLLSQLKKLPGGSSDKPSGAEITDEDTPF
jgi:hypothetical protein